MFLVSHIRFVPIVPPLKGKNQPPLISDGKIILEDYAFLKYDPASHLDNECDANIFTQKIINFLKRK